MNEIAQLVADIQMVISSGGNVEKAEVLKLAAAYVRVCRQINEKAYQCRDMLRDGLGDRAVSFAEEEPPLAAGAEFLNFPERRAWIDLCESMGLEMRQHDLNADVIARVLSDLHADSDAFEAVLKVHRRLALGQAPLVNRLEVLRQLADLDRQRSFWDKDIRTFEEARLLELEKEAEQAGAEGDLGGLETVLAELDSDVWLTPPPEQLVTKVEEITLPHRARSAQERFVQLSEQIRAAHSVPDERRARALIGQWQQVISQTGMRPAQDLVDNVASVQAWLAELDKERQEETEFEEACMALEAALDEGRKQPELEKLAATVLRFGLDMPELLAARFNSRIAELQRAGRRRFSLALAGIIGVLLIVAAGIAVYLVLSGYQDRVNEWHTKIDRALNEGELETAAAHFETLKKDHADIYAEAVIQNDLARYNQLVAEEETRLKHYAEARDKVKKEIEAFKATAEDVLEHESAETFLAEADKLARRAEEKSEMFNLRSEYDKETERRGELYRAKVDKILNGLQETMRKAVEAGDKAKFQDAIDQARDVRTEALKIKFNKKATDGQRAQAEKLLNEAAQLVKEVQALRQDLRAIRLAYNQAGNLVKALQNFTTQHPNHELTTDFERAVTMSTVWEPVVDWHARAAAWHTTVLVHDRTKIEQRLTSIQEHLQKYVDSPYKAAGESYEALLTPAREALDPDEGGLIGLNDANEMLAHPLIAALHMVETKTGDRYYLLGDRVELLMVRGQPYKYNFRYIVDGKLTDKPVGLAVAAVKLTGTKPPLAPQVRFAQDARGLIGKFDGSNWRTLYLRLAALAQKQTDIDPCLRATLIKNLLGWAGECCKGPAFAKPRKDIQAMEQALSGDEWDKYRWMDPDPDRRDADVRKARLTAKTILNGLKDVKPIIAGIEGVLGRQRNQLAASLISYRPVGILLMAAGEAEILATKVGPGELYVIGTDQTGRADYCKIGEVTAKGTTVDADAAKRRPRGCPVFLKVQRTPAGPKGSTP